jgi:hypothetical protein
VVDIFPTSAPDIPGAPASIPGTPTQVPSFGEVPHFGAASLRDMQGRFVTNGFGYEWFNLVELFQQPQVFASELVNAAKENMQELAQEIQQYAQENAPWQDRSGDARRGLKALFIDRGVAFEIDLGHSVYYGWYLENYDGGRLAIIQPTLQEFAPQMAAIAGHLNDSAVDLEGALF